MSSQKTDSLKDLMSVVNSPDIGLVIFDNDYNIRVWNLFMVTHSGLSANSVMGNNIFKQFPDISKSWFYEKIQSCIEKKKKLISLWQERQYLFKFKNNRNRSKSAAFMYQNITFIPLSSANGEIENFAIMITDVTDIAVSTQQHDAVVDEYSKKLEQD